LLTKENILVGKKLKKYFLENILFAEINFPVTAVKPFSFFEVFLVSLPLYYGKVVRPERRKEEKKKAAPNKEAIENRRALTAAAAEVVVSATAAAAANVGFGPKLAWKSLENLAFRGPVEKLRVNEKNRQKKEERRKARQPVAYHLVHLPLPYIDEIQLHGMKLSFPFNPFQF